MNDELNERDLATELAESDDLRNRMSKILRDTADALHGGPLEDGYWSWHDLPALVYEMRDENDSHVRTILGLRSDIANLKAYITDVEKPISDNPNRDKAYVTMVETARAHGVTPLDPETFKVEDKRILTEWQRRRKGVDTAEADYEKTLDKNSRRVWPQPIQYRVRLSFWQRVQKAWRVLRGRA